MKKISVLIPCYNEAENVGPISRAVTEILEKELPRYDYELVFIDNDSTDGTRDIIRGLCADNPRIKPYSMPGISVSSIPPITECSRSREIASSRWWRISRTCGNDS